MKPPLPFYDTDAELEYVEYQQAYDEWWDILQKHIGNRCPPSLSGEHCMVCEHSTGDPFYAWRRLMIINRQPMKEMEWTSAPAS
jgi:hypothetical protein